MILRVLSCFAALVLVTTSACGPNGGDGGDDVDAGVSLDDDDGDGIVNDHENKAEGVDTDSDGTPDYLDLDSDGDEIPDAVEAGDDQLETAPQDSDSDGVADFRDPDSDGNGVLDAIEGAADLDSDGAGNFADADNDGDAISDLIELGGSAASPPDSDGDGTPDYMDIDSDADFILDADERDIDADLDGVFSYLDDDSDGDCILDIDEAGDAILNTPPADSDGDNRPNFHDRDADNDGLTDSAEDLNCNGALDIGEGETSPTDGDSDGDDVSDLIEVTAGTDPNDPADNPRARGDFVFVVPYEEPTSPAADDLDFSTDLRVLDIFVMVDRSGSMTQEITSIRDNIMTVANNITCPPNGNGPPETCIPDVWWGAGTVGYSIPGGQPFNVIAQMGPSAAPLGNLPTTAPPGGPTYPETTLLSTWSVCTGGGSAQAGCSVGDPWGPAASCTNGGSIGYACFRPNALPVILMATDEAPIQGSDTYHCPAAATVCNVANAISAKIVGVKGDTVDPIRLQEDLEYLTGCTGSVDANNGNAPLVVSGVNSGAAAAIESAIRTLAQGVPLDISAVANDTPDDPVNAVTAFIERLETQQLGTPDCASGLIDQDSNGDGYDDIYLDVSPGTGVCWNLVPRMNTTVTPTEEPQLYQATIDVYGDGITPLDSRDVYFLVPPEIIDVVIE